MTLDLSWGDPLTPLALDLDFGFLRRGTTSPRLRHPQVVLNGPGESVLRILREELAQADAFLFSVAFVTPRALTLLKQEFVDFGGSGTIITSDYLAFNTPQAFVELMNLERLGIKVRLHPSAAFHPKGYIFRNQTAVTAMIGSSNLTENALVTNHEWNLKVTAAARSDLARQFDRLVADQLSQSVPLTEAWIDEYAARYIAPAPRPPRPIGPLETPATPDQPDGLLVPNGMQLEALAALAEVRAQGKDRALIISATGTGKTILSALDVRAAATGRVLFVAHREQILDRTMSEYRRVLGGSPSNFGKLTGLSKQAAAPHVFATVQTLSQAHVLETFAPDAFDYVIIDEAHRAGAPTHRRVIDHFRPAFLLGMTATPERTDDFNIFELFDHNVPYEIRLGRALEEDMLCPFHYFGVAEVTLADGSTLTGEEDVRVLVGPDRIDHLITQIETYGLASVTPRGLIFCSRRDEAIALAEALNTRTLHGVPIAAQALTGADSVATREDAVARLERGELHYLVTVDIFNEGVDIPCVNQVIMLRQTQSAIVFVQQLGRGLRKAPGKECVIVLDFIGNYANNFLIPIALFGDESLNKESLKQHMISAEERGVLPGLASVRFDQISQERVLRSIATTKLNSLVNLKRAIEQLRNRLGRVPTLTDFTQADSVDAVILATSQRTYPELVSKTLRLPHGLSEAEVRWLDLLTNEVLTAKRPHECALVAELLRGPMSDAEAAELFARHGWQHDKRTVDSVAATLTLSEHAEADVKRYGGGIATRSSTGTVTLLPDVTDAFGRAGAFAEAVLDLLTTGAELVARRYADADPFVRGRQYSRKEVTRLLGWPRKWTPTVYGYRVDRPSGSCAIFVTLHKSDAISASTAYQDALLDPTTMLWYTRSRRTLESDEVRAIVANDVTLDVFVKKDDAEGTEFYHLGRATSRDAEQTTMTDGNGKLLDVVRMHLTFPTPIEPMLFDYFHPVTTA